MKLECFLREINDRTNMSNQYPVLTASIEGIFLQSEYFKKSVASKDNTGYKIIKKGQFTYRAMSDTGKFFPNRLDCTTIGIVSPAYPVFEISDPNLIESDYLRYFFKSTRFQNSIKFMATGSTRTSVKFNKIKEVEIELPSISLQRKQLKILSKVEILLKENRQKSLYYDKLIKSRFIEMFGNPSDDLFEKKSLPEITVSDKTALKRGPFGGSLKKRDFVSKGYLVYEQKHAIHNDFKYEKYYISESKYRDMLAFKVIPGDLIVSCSGVTLGRIAEVPFNAKEGIINQALLKISLDQNVMKNRFYMELFRHKEMQDILFGFSRGSGIPNFPPMTEVKKVKFLCPPILLQEKYVEFLLLVDKLKIEVQKSIDEYQTLFDSLMQEYFG